MPTLQIRNLPQKLYDDLKKSAKDSRRSLTQEAIALLEKAMTESDVKINKDRRSKLLSEIDKNRKLSKAEADLAIQWVREDRDSR